jgi:hypothetical protein
MGALGTGINSHPTRRLTVDLPSLRLRSLPRLGQTVTLRWQGAARPLLARLTRTPAEVVIELGGTSTQVLLRSWPMPAGSRRDSREFTIDRMICPRCDAPRNILHWGGEEIGWECRGRNCLDLDFPVRHQLRWCPSIRRRAKLLRAYTRAGEGP